MSLEIIALLLACTSCEWLSENSEGRICLKFLSDSYVSTKANVELPDTNDFILTVTKSDGSVVYSGAYGASPESLMISPGTYDVKVVSSDFTKPQFDSPQYGDEQCVVVKSGGVSFVELVCRQMNAGMKLNVSSAFLTSYPDGVLFLKSSEGKLMYAYKEKRIAYFNPGNVSLVLSESQSEKTLITKTLMSQEILTLNVSVAASSSNSTGSEDGISISVDTTRHWSSENVSIGDGSSDNASGDYNSAYSITDAKNNVGAKGVWVCGYIVGGDMSSSSNGIKFSGPFNSETHIAIASRSSVTTKSSCMSVQLPSGTTRAALNLVSNPGNLGKKIYIKGDIVSSYYGVPGIKNISDYVLK